MRGTPVASDTVRGVVYDSLLMAPLADVFVTAHPGGESVTTDSIGRFLLVSEQPIRQVLAVHADLDRIGLGELTATLPPAAVEGSARRVTLATPSIRTVWQRLCGGPQPDKGQGGILFGSTRQTDGRTLQGGATIEVQWESIRQRTDTMPHYESRMARSDSLGQFVVCGVQEFGQAGVMASAGALRSGNVLLMAEERAVRRVDLMLAPPRAPGVRVQGIVHDGAGAPVRDATVSIDGLEVEARTDTAGRFSMMDVPGGSRMLAARKVGMLPVLQTIDVWPGMAALAVVLERGITLEGVSVTARRTVNRALADLLDRQRVGWAKYLDSSKVRDLPRMVSALRMFPTLRVEFDSTKIGYHLLGRLGCTVRQYVDGVEVHDDDLETVPLDIIATIEMYPSDQLAPIQYRSFERPCALVLVWTKLYLRHR